MQAVLQFHRGEVRLYFCKNLASALYFLIVFMFFVHETGQLIVAVCGVDVVLLFPVEFSEVLQHHRLGKAVLCTFLDTLFPGINGV